MLGGRNNSLVRVGASFRSNCIVAPKLQIRVSVNSCLGEDFFDLGGQEESVSSRPITAKSALEGFTSSRPASSTIEPTEPEGNDNDGEEDNNDNGNDNDNDNDNDNGEEDSIEETVAQILDDDNDEALDD